MTIPTDDITRAETLHAAALDAAGRMRESRRELCILLARLDGDRLYRTLGFGSLHAYAEARLGLKPRTARAMALLGRRLPALPALDAALATGELSWTRGPVGHSPVASAAHRLSGVVTSSVTCSRMLPPRS